MINEAIILAGGLGTRLRSAVPGIPKCMAPVNGKPFLSFLIDYCTRQGITSFIFSLGYLHEQVERFLEEKLRQQSLRATYKISLEQEPLGTGGAVLRACRSSDEENVFVLNGDTFFAVDCAKLGGFHKENTADCTLALKPMTDFSRYGVVEIDQKHRITSFHEKKYYASGLINGGAYAINRNRFLEEDLPEKFSFEKDYLEKIYKQRNMFGFVQDHYFIDIGIPEDYQRAQTELEKYW